MNTRSLLIDAITTIEMILTAHPTADPVALALMALHDRLCEGVQAQDALDATGGVGEVAA